MLPGGDMIVSLYHLPEVPVVGGVQIKRAFPADKTKILDFIREHFSENWVNEAEQAIVQDVPKCFIAVENGKIIGFSCFDSSAKSFFGPIGVDKSRRGDNVGTALLLRTLNAMREFGYAYAIIGWVTDAAEFYKKTVGATFIPNGGPENSVYSNMVDVCGKFTDAEKEYFIGTLSCDGKPLEVLEKVIDDKVPIDKKTGNVHLLPADEEKAEEITEKIKEKREEIVSEFKKNGVTITGAGSRGNIKGVDYKYSLFRLAEQKEDSWTFQILFILFYKTNGNVVNCALKTLQFCAYKGDEPHSIDLYPESDKNGVWNGDKTACYYNPKCAFDASAEDILKEFKGFKTKVSEKDKGEKR